MSNQTWELKIAQVSGDLAEARRKAERARNEEEAHRANAEMLERIASEKATELRELAQEYAK